MSEAKPSKAKIRPSANEEETDNTIFFTQINQFYNLFIN